MADSMATTGQLVPQIASDDTRAGELAILTNMNSVAHALLAGVVHVTASENLKIVNDKRGTLQILNHHDPKRSRDDGIELQLDQANAIGHRDSLSPLLSGMSRGRRV
jgi:hypothetical protein